MLWLRRSLPKVSLLLNKYIAQHRLPLLVLFCVAVFSSV